MAGTCKAAPRETDSGVAMLARDHTPSVFANLRLCERNAVIEPNSPESMSDTLCCSRVGVEFSPWFDSAYCLASVAARKT